MHGLRIKSVKSGSLAEAIGLLPSDIIIEYNGVAINGETRLLLASIDAAKTKERVSILIDRNGQHKVFEAQPASLGIEVERMSQKGNHMKTFFFFDSMLTPKIITFVYWLALLFAVVQGLWIWRSMFAVYGGFHFDFINFLLGLGIIVGGTVGARLSCELLIVLFKIHQYTKRLADKQA